MTESLVELTGGRIGVESRADKSATFRLELMQEKDMVYTGDHGLVVRTIVS